MLGAADMPIGCALTFSEPAQPLRHHPNAHGRDKPGHAEQIDLWTLLRRRLALDRLALAMAGFAAKE